nr:2Fe-2S iron-sulfur cluster-binding protein [Paenibacillus senegalensis]
MTLLAAGRKAGAGIRTRCGGKAGCLMCKVIVEDQQGLSPLTRAEVNKLGNLAEQGYRLACQAKITGAVSVLVPEDPLRAAVRALLAKQKEEDDWD